MERCSWCNLNNKLYVDYHDNEWCQANFNDKYLFEMLILESFQAGLSWECVNFSIDKVCNYGNDKIIELTNNKDIIRNKLKINASINNAKIFKNIVLEFGSFYNYLKKFTNDEIFYETGLTSSSLSDTISNDLKRRGMKFVGTTIIYSYLQAIGIIYSHEKCCFMYKEK